MYITVYQAYFRTTNLFEQDLRQAKMYSLCQLHKQFLITLIHLLYILDLIVK